MVRPPVTSEPQLFSAIPNSGAIGGFHFAHHLAQRARIFFPRARLHAAAHIDPERLCFGDGLGDIVRPQPARHDYAAVAAGSEGEPPIRGVPCAAIKTATMAVQEKRGSRSISR